MPCALLAGLTPGCHAIENTLTLCETSHTSCKPIQDNTSLVMRSWTIAIEIISWPNYHRCFVAKIGVNLMNIGITDHHFHQLCYQSREQNHNTNPSQSCRGPRTWRKQCSRRDRRNPPPCPPPAEYQRPPAQCWTGTLWPNNRKLQ